MQIVTIVNKYVRGHTLRTDKKLTHIFLTFINCHDVRLTKTNLFEIESI